MPPGEPDTTPVNRPFDPFHLVQRLSSIAFRAMPSWTRSGAPGSWLVVITGRSWQIRFNKGPAAATIAVGRAVAHVVSAMSRMVDGRRPGLQGH